jgi:hypothetical protein
MTVFQRRTAMTVSEKIKAGEFIRTSGSRTADSALARVVKKINRTTRPADSVTAFLSREEQANKDFLLVTFTDAPAPQGV